jgi:IS605 OrfB family transposase
MKQIITAKLKLITTKEQNDALMDIGSAYRNACNYASQKAFELNKTTNANLLHKNVYNHIRQEYLLPSQIACSVSRYVTAAYKTLWKKFRSNKKHQKKGYTKKAYKGLSKPPKYTERTVPYQYGYDYTFKANQQVSIMTLNGRLKLPYQGWNYHVNLIKGGNIHIGNSHLYYDRISKTYFLLVSLELEIPDFIPTDHKSVAGVDVGQRYLAVTTDTKHNTLFQSGKEAIQKSNQYNRKIKELKAKKKAKHGTRYSINRRLIALSKRERRHKQSLNHSTAKEIVERFPDSLIGMEDLTDIRDRTNRRSSKKASKKQKKANNNKSKWSFAELQAFIAYKAVINGSMTTKVDAHYTSKSCPLCGHTDDKNRPNNGLLFVCQNCNFTLHSDLVGSRNITLRTLLIRQDWISTGELSTRPDASDCEIETDYRKKYSGLRWSPEVIKL